jgi:hypothetical protein
MNKDTTTPKPPQPEQPADKGLDGAACSPPRNPFYASEKWERRFAKMRSDNQTPLTGDAIRLSVPLQNEIVGVIESLEIERDVARENHTKAANALEICRDALAKIIAADNSPQGTVFTSYASIALRKSNLENVERTCADD